MTITKRTLTPQQEEALAAVIQAQKDYLAGIEELKARRQAVFINAAHRKVGRELIAENVGVSTRTVSTIMNGR